MSFSGFSGLPGETSHQTRSSPRDCRHIRVRCRCPSCAGLKEPPRRPTFSPGVSISRRMSGTNLTAAAHQIFEARELLDADGSARMELARRDADFRAHAELGI